MRAYTAEVMPHDRSRALRLLRVLLACALVWVSSASADTVRAWSDVAAIVISGAPDRDFREEHIAPDEGPPRSGDRSRALPSPVALTLPAQSSGTLGYFVLIEQRYLHNLALLC